MKEEEKNHKRQEKKKLAKWKSKVRELERGLGGVKRPWAQMREPLSLDSRCEAMAPVSSGLAATNTVASWHGWATHPWMADRIGCVSAQCFAS